MEFRLREVRIVPGSLDRAEQVRLLDDLRAVVAAAPMVHPETSRGRRMSVRMTSAGDLGWVSDRRGYRYEPRHPSGAAWPPIPKRLLTLWRRLCAGASDPDTCLVNFYGEGARMGLHRDVDEADHRHPVLSLSLGDEGLFRVGGSERGGPTESVWLTSGDVAILEGPGRLVYHGIDRIRFRSSSLLKEGGRLNVTLRVAGRGCAGDGLPS